MRYFSYTFTPLDSICSWNRLVLSFIFSLKLLLSLFLSWIVCVQFLDEMTSNWQVKWQAPVAFIHYFVSIETLSTLTSPKLSGKKSSISWRPVTNSVTFHLCFFITNSPKNITETVGNVYTTTTRHCNKHIQLKIEWEVILKTIDCYISTSSIANPLKRVLMF